MRARLALLGLVMLGLAIAPLAFRSGDVVRAVLAHGDEDGGADDSEADDCSEAALTECEAELESCEAELQRLSAKLEKK